MLSGCQQSLNKAKCSFFLQTAAFPRWRCGFSDQMFWRMKSTDIPMFPPSSQRKTLVRNSVWVSSRPPLLLTHVGWRPSPYTRKTASLGSQVFARREFFTNMISISIPIYTSDRLTVWFLARMSLLIACGFFFFFQIRFVGFHIKTYINMLKWL